MTQQQPSLQGGVASDSWVVLAVSLRMRQSVHQQSSGQFLTIKPRDFKHMSRGTRDIFLLNLEWIVHVEPCPLIGYVGTFSNALFHVVFTVWIAVEFMCRDRVQFI